MGANDTVPLGRPSSPEIGDGRLRMAKADLRKAEVVDWRPAIGRAIERCRLLVELTLKEFAAALPSPDGAQERDERQVARWIAGTERPQMDAIFSVPEFRAAMVVGLAELAQDVDVVTTITVRRRRPA